MKRINLFRTLLLFALTPIAALVASAAEKPEMKFVNARDLTIINEAQPGSGAPAYRRINVANYPGLNKKQAELLNQSAGITVLFKTNSPFIYLKWRNELKSQNYNMNSIGQNGMDLYIKDNGKWKFAGIAKPGRELNHETEVVSHMDSSTKECLLTLPIFNTVMDLEIGVAPGSTIEAMPNPYKKRFLIAGSSITNGTGASRPGRIYSAWLGRRLGVETPNLGMSGQWKLEPELANLIADSKADAIMIDGFSNPSAEEIRERLLPFVKRIREAHPNIPIIFIQTLERDTRNFNLEIRKFEDDKRAAAAEMMAQVMKKYKNIYFINPGMPIGDDFDATVDGTHPTDLGYQRMLDVITPQIERILRANKVL